MASRTPSTLYSDLVRLSLRNSPKEERATPSSPFSPPTPSGSPPSRSPISTQPETVRESYSVICNRFYPNIHPRHDWDILVLASRSFKDGYGDFYAFSDSYLEGDHSRFTAEQVIDGRARAQIMREATELLDSRDTPTGVCIPPSLLCGEMLKGLRMKPSPGDDDVHIRPIPHSDYSLRIWGKGLELKHHYRLDFIRTETGEPVNSPFEYELWVVPDSSTPWLPTGTGRVYSLEQNFGIDQKDILLGEEKFEFLEGITCILLRPGMRPVRFKVPVRHANHNIADIDDIAFS